MRIIRQGDVWLYEVDQDDHDLGDNNWRAVRESNGHTVLALGEATGHAHRIRSRRARLHVRQMSSSMRMLPLSATRLAEFPPSRRRLLTVAGSKPVALTHEEHETLQIPPGTWEMRIQREYDPEQVANSRLVYD